MSNVFALVDCNNFYASCEKLFRPDLRHRPVVVLSNNDGCVIARSKEAKALGIKMGVPVFKIQQEIRAHKIKVFSSNFALYADMSARVMNTLESMVPSVEIYSIDEAFLDLSHTQAIMPLQQYGENIRQAIGQWIGIPVCVGIAPSKTLAKLANYAAKKFPATQGVVDLTSPQRQRRLMELVPVEEIWGIGRRLGKRLHAMGVRTALDLADSPEKLIRKQFSVVVERTVRELNGESCIALEEIPAAKKQIVCSRSFGQRVTTFNQMREAVCEHTVRAGEKLRKERQQAKVLTVFIRTSPFSTDRPQYSNAASSELVNATDNTRDLIALAVKLLRQIWRDDYHYAKCGGMLSDFYAAGIYQPDIFDVLNTHTAGNRNDATRSNKLMTLMDQVNRKNKGGLFFAGQGIKKKWAIKREHLSPAYTTRWGELPKVR